MTALTQAVTVNPQPESARDGLATILTESGYLDGAFGGNAAGKRSWSADVERFTLLTALVARLEDEVLDREHSFQVQPRR